MEIILESFPDIFDTLDFTFKTCLVSFISIVMIFGPITIFSLCTKIENISKYLKSIIYTPISENSSTEII